MKNAFGGLILSLFGSHILASDFLSIDDVNKILHIAFTKTPVSQKKFKLMMDLPVQSKKGSLITLNYGEPAKKCPLSDQEIQKSQTIIREGLAYIKGFIKNIHET